VLPKFSGNILQVFNILRFFYIFKLPRVAEITGEHEWYICGDDAEGVIHY